METYKDYIWTMKDDTQVKVGDMSTSHIINSIKLMKRALEHWSAEESAAWSCLCSFQGEMAQYYCERDIAEMGRIQIALMSWIEILEVHLKWRTDNITLKHSRWPQLFNKLSHVSTLKST